MTSYIIEHKRPGHSWRVDDVPVEYASMTEAELAAAGVAYNGLETRVVPVEGSAAPKPVLRKKAPYTCRHLIGTVPFGLKPCAAILTEEDGSTCKEHAPPKLRAIWPAAEPLAAGERPWGGA